MRNYIVNTYITEPSVKEICYGEGVFKDYGGDLYSFIEPLKRQGLILSKANHDFSIVSKGGNFSCLGETFSRVIIFHFKAKTEIRNFTTYFYIIYFQKEDEDIFSDLLSLEKEILSITSKLDNFSLSFASKKGLKVKPTIVNQLLLYLFNRSFEEPSVLYQENDPLQSFINLVEINKMLPKELKKQFSFIVNDNGISPINVNIYSSDDVSLRKENIQTKVCLLDSLNPIQDDIYDPTVYQKILVYYLKDRDFASLFNDKIDFKKLLSLGEMIQDKYVSSYNVLETIINLKVVKDNDYYLLEQVQSYLMTYLTDNEFYDYEVLYYLQTTDNDYSLPNLVNKIVNDDNYELALTLVYFYRSYLSCLLHNDKQLNIDLTIELVKVIKGFLDNNNYINDYFFSFIFGIEPYIISDELLLKEIYLFCLIDSFNFETQKSSILNQLIGKFKDILKNEYYANDLLEDIQISRDLFDALINNNLIENTSYRLYLKKLRKKLLFIDDSRIEGYNLDQLIDEYRNEDNEDIKYRYFYALEKKLKQGDAYHFEDVVTSLDQPIFLDLLNTSFDLTNEKDLINLKSSVKDYKDIKSNVNNIVSKIMEEQKAFITLRGSLDSFDADVQTLEVKKSLAPDFSYLPSIIISFLNVLLTLIEYFLIGIYGLIGLALVLLTLIINLIINFMYAKTDIETKNKVIFPSLILSTTLPLIIMLGATFIILFL